MKYGRKYGDDRAEPIVLERKPRAISRDTQLRLQADYCEGVLQHGLTETERAEYPELFSEIDWQEKSAITGDVEARRDLAWLRLYRRR